MNMYRAAAFGVVVTAVIAGCDNPGPDSESLLDGHHAAMQRCQALAGDYQDVCIKEAEAALARAKAEATLTSNTAVSNDTASASTSVVAAHEEAADTMDGAEYGVARAKCDSFVGETRDGCIKRARSEFARN